tara:strand:- start:182 stop:490 length:309 start_codon:yes stop_codon:yes gene_type:complete
MNTKYLDMIYQELTKDNLLGTYVSLFLVLYGGLAGPQLPKTFKNLFEKPLFKLIVLSLVAYSSVKDFRLSILLAISFVISISMFDNRYISECFKDLEEKKKR